MGLDARSLIWHPAKGTEEMSRAEVAIRVARDCARHGLPLPPQQVRELLRHVEICHGAAIQIDQFLRNVQLSAESWGHAVHRRYWVSQVPWEIARRMRNQLRRAIGSTPILADEQGVL